MEVVNNETSTTNSNEESLYYPVKPTKLVSRPSEQTQQTARCSDFSDFSPDALGEIGFAFKQQQQDDSARTRSTVNIDDSFRTRDGSYRTSRSSTRLSFSQRYDLDLQTENEELKLELINVQAERDDLKTQISLMSWEIAQLRDQLKLRDSQLVKQELAHTAAKRASFESDNAAPDTPTKSKRSLLGRGGSLRGLFKSSSKKSLTEEDHSGLPTEVSVPTSPKKNRRSMLKRIFSGKGKDKFAMQDTSESSAMDKSSEMMVPDDSMRSMRSMPDYEDQEIPLRDTPQVARVTMAGYKKNERVHVLRWSRTPIEEETSISGDSDMDSTSSEHYEEDKSGTNVSAKQELEHEVSWYREAPGMNIQWKRIPATPVFNVQWKRIPSSRQLVAKEEQQAPVMNIKWERIPSSRTLQAVRQEPVLIKWERVPSRASIQKYEPVLNIKWERIPSFRKLTADEQEPVLNIKWERIPSSRKLTADEELVHNLYWYRIAPTPVLNIEWKRIPSSRTLEVKQEELVHDRVWAREPWVDIRWERVPATREIFTIEEEYPKAKAQDDRWEKLPSEPIMNVQWERVSSKKQLQEEGDDASSDWETASDSDSSSSSSSSDDSSTSSSEEEEDLKVPTVAESKAAADYENYLRNSFSFAGKDTYDDCSDDDLDLDVLESLTNAAAAATQNLVQMHSLDNAMLSPTTAKPLKSCLKSPDAVKKKSITKRAGFSGDDMQVEVDLMSPPKKRGVIIRESINQVNRVSKIRGSAWDNCFFTEDEMAEFKYEAFLEECGLTEDDF